MSGRRIVVTGLGGELGSLVGAMLEEQSWVGTISGLDVNPPRRRLKRSSFQLVDAFDRRGIMQFIADADPHVIIHVGVWEPHARVAAPDAKAFTDAMSEAVFDAAMHVPHLESVVVRSGIEVYGTHGHWPKMPNEHQILEPESTFGHMLLNLEHRASELAIQRGTAITMLRLAPVVGPHVPSPLGRVLRLPLVAFNPLGAPEFSVVEDHDAAAAFVAAAQYGPHGAINVVAPGSMSVTSAAALGRRVGVPTIGPGWWIASQLATFAGAPVPDHVTELLMNGRCASGELARELLGFQPQRSTREVIEHLYEWPSVIRVKSNAA